MRIEAKSINPKYLQIGDILVYVDSDSETSYYNQVVETLGEHFTESTIKLSGIPYYKVTSKPYLIEDDDYFEIEIEWINRPDYLDEDDATITFENITKKRLFIVNDDEDYDIFDRKTFLKLGVFTIISFGIAIGLSMIKNDEQ